VSDDDLDKMLTPEELAEWWNVSKDWIWDAVQAGRIPHTRIGTRTLRFRRADMIDYLKRAEGGTDD
jgi:excisionase family DNA binding protein